MPADGSDDNAALIQLRAYLAQRDLQPNAQLPAEREFAVQLGTTRGALRKALAQLEAEGQVWRHVGKGTFVGGRPVEEPGSLAEITGSTNPSEVMRARILFEPELAREAALHATDADIRQMRACLARSRDAESWRQYESWDNTLHRTIALAARNPVLLALFDHLNAIRRAVVWGRLRAERAGPPSSHHSFREHEIVVAAIADRDMDGAAEAMRDHLNSVAFNLLNGRLGRTRAPDRLAAEG
ncbi:MAG: FadR/GntR family transcriptional regulator [Alphaproteobacteria bacterium]